MGYFRFATLRFAITLYLPHRGGREKKNASLTNPDFPPTHQNQAEATMVIAREHPPWPMLTPHHIPHCAFCQGKKRLNSLQCIAHEHRRQREPYPSPAKVALDALVKAAVCHTHAMSSQTIVEDFPLLCAFRIVRELGEQEDAVGWRDEIDVPRP